MIQIRAARWEDRTSLIRLIEQLEEVPIDREAFDTVYRENLDLPQVSYQIALLDGKLVGMVSVHFQKLLHHAAQIAEIQELVVDEQYRGQGIGKRLFMQAKQIAVDAGCSQLECACNQRRTASHAFYRAQSMACRHFKFTLPLDKKDGFKM